MKYRIVIIEGPSKIGKNTQTFLLSNKIDKNQVFTTGIIPNPKDMMDLLVSIRDWLKLSPDNKAILNGSIATTLALKDIESSSYGSSLKIYDDEVRYFLELVKDFKTKSILIKPSNYDALSKRMDNYNYVEMGNLYNGIRHFENYYSNASFKWDILEINPQEPILQIHEKILKKLLI